MGQGGNLVCELQQNTGFPASGLRTWWLIRVPVLLLSVIVGCDLSTTLAFPISTPTCPGSPPGPLLVSKVPQLPFPAPPGAISPSDHQVSGKRHPQSSVSHRGGRSLISWVPRGSALGTLTDSGNTGRQQGKISIFLMLPNPGTKTRTQTTAETKCKMFYSWLPCGGPDSSGSLGFFWVSALAASRGHPRAFLEKSWVGGVFRRNSPAHV